MKRVCFLVVFCCCLGILPGFTPSKALAIEAYFDSEISTSLDVKPDIGTLQVRMLDESVPVTFRDVIYERIINVEIILDVSKTMEEPDINGVRKFDIAKQLAKILVEHFPQRDTQFALRVNGAKYQNNCLDSELLIPFGRRNGARVLDAIERLTPKGMSPLTYSMRQLLHDFKGTKGTKLVFIITDGIETCDVEPVDACTVTMDMLIDADFDASINFLGINTVYKPARDLLACLSARSNGEFLDSNRNNGRQLGRLIREASQPIYNISKILDPETRAEGKILELINRRIGDASTMDGEQVVMETRQGLSYSEHELKPGIYKIEFATVPSLVSYFTIDNQQQLTIALVRSGEGFDLYDRAHLALGNRYYDQGQFEAAQQEYQKVLEFDERNVDAHLNMGILYQDIFQDQEQAAYHYKTYLELQGPRQQEASAWLRQARGLPSPEEERQQKLQEREEAQAREETERQAQEEAEQQEKDRQQAFEAYNEILTANPDIAELSEDEVRFRDTIHVTVYQTTTDSKARNIALDVGKRIARLLERTPSTIEVYRENAPETPISRAVYDRTQQRHIIVELTELPEDEVE